MSEIEVHRVSDGGDRSLPIFAEFERMADRIRMEAYKLFAHRGAGDGHALDDWLAAERACAWPQAELAEAARKFSIKVALAGFDPEEISVTATPSEIMVRARQEQRTSGGDDKVELKWSEFRSNDVMRRFELPEEVDVGAVSARLRHGLLEITAPKSKSRTRSAKAKAGTTAATDAQSRSKVKATSSKSKTESTTDLEYSAPT